MNGQMNELLQCYFKVLLTVDERTEEYVIMRGHSNKLMVQTNGSLVAGQMMNR